MLNLNNRPTGLELYDAAEIARIYQRHQLARRIRRVSRVAIIATKNDISWRQRRVLKWKRQLKRFSQQLAYNQYRIAAACAVIVFGLSSFVPLFLQADTSRSITLDSSVQKLIGETRDDASKYLSYDSKTSEYAFAIPDEKSTDLSDHTGRIPDAYNTSLAQTAQEGITVTDKKTKIAVTLKSEFFTTPARKSEGNHIVYRSGNKQVIYTHKYNGLKEDIILGSPVTGSSIHTFKLSLPSGVEARLDKQGNIGIYSSDPTLFGDITFDKEQDRQNVEKARENGAKTNLVMVIPYPVVKDSTGTEYSDRAKFTLSEKRTAKGTADTSGLPADVAKAAAGKTQLNEYTLTLRADNLKNLSYPISIDPTMQVRDAADFGLLNIESGSDLDTTNSLIKRGSLTGGGLQSWVSNATHLPYSASKHGATIYNGYLYIHGGLTATGNDFRVYYASIDTATGTIGAFNPASAVVGAGRSTHAIFAYNGFFYIVGNGSAGGTGPTSYAKINSDGTLGTFTAATNQIIGRRFASYSLVNGYLYVAGGCTAFSSAVDTGDCTAFASTVEYAQIKPNGSLSAWQNTSAFTGNRMLGSLTNYNGYLYYSGGQDDGDIFTAAVSFNTVFISKQNSDGSLSSWSTNTMPGTKNSHMTVVYNGYLYEVGGYNTIIYYAPIYADGSIGTWITDTPLPAQYAVGVLLAANNNLFLVGGSSASTGDEILVAGVRPAGATQNFASSTSFGTARYYNTTTVFNGYIYVAGGCTDSGGTYNSCTATTSVEFAKINTNGTIGSWASTTALPAARNAHAAAAYNGYLYLTGGCKVVLTIQQCNQGDTVYALLNPNNGTVGAWTTDTTNTFPVRREHQSVAYNGYLYVIDGHNNAAINQLSYTALSPTNGSIGAWTTNNTPSAGNLVGAVVYGGYLYISQDSAVKYAPINDQDGSIGTWLSAPLSITGVNSSITASNGMLYVLDNNQLYYASLTSNGAPGSFSTVGTLATNRPGKVLLSYTNFIYAVGGCTSLSGSTCNGPSNTTEYAQINNGGGGITGSWASTTNLPSARRFEAVVASNSFVYLTGGETSAGALNELRYAQIASDGTLGSWSSGPNLPAVRKGHSSVIYNNKLYVIAGTDSGGSGGLTQVYYITINSNGGFTGQSWQTASFNFPGHTYNTSAAVYNGILYVKDAWDGGNVAASCYKEVYYTTFQSNGNISSWTNGGQMLSPHRQSSLLAYGGYLYSGGGYTCTSATFSNRIEFAPINSNGSIGTWKYASDFMLPRGRGDMVVSNGFMYFLAGQNNGSNQRADYFFAPILANGRVGTWNQPSSPSLSTARVEQASFTYQGKIYVLGGTDLGSPSATYYNTVEYATQQAIPRVANFSRLYDFDVGVRPTKLITRGTKPAGSVAALSYSSSSNLTNALDNAQTVSDVGYTGANSQAVSLGTNRTLSRYLFLRYTLDDSLSAIFPDSGNESKITDFDMYYIANPGDRLRGGRTFTNGVDRGLDAQPQ